MRLRRSSPSEPGIRRRARGRGFRYVDADGASPDDETLQRIRALAIPPAWTDVWICSSGQGHLQAVGTDAAGRQQYLYHQDWTASRDLAKFDRMVRFANALPQARRRVALHLRVEEPTRRRALACAFRIMDSALVRTGSEQYVRSSGSRGLSTMLCSAVTIHGSDLRLAFRGKAGVQHDLHIDDGALAAAVRPMAARSASRRARLLAYRVGGTWCEIHSTDINDYVKDVVGEEFTAKDFRTWHATVAAADVLMSTEPPVDRRALAAATRAAAAEAANRLGNTPAVARRSYIDPRIFKMAELHRLPPAGRRSTESVVREVLGGSRPRHRGAT